jgi:predicted aldo/keto reductase-like oxidoreductase
MAAVGGGIRDRLVIHTGLNIRGGERRDDILKSLDESLQRLGTDRVEIFRTSDVDDPGRVRLEELFEAFEEAKRAGKVLHLGMSGHGRKLTGCLQEAIDDGRFGLLMCRYDFVSYKEQQQRLFRRANQKGMGVVVFKISAGERQKEIRDLEAGGLSFRQATVKWALSNPDITSVCAGITSFDEIDEYCGAVGKSLEQRESAMLQRYAEIMHKRYCRNCGTCEPACPSSVAVADIMRYAMYFKYYGREKDSMQLYASLPKGNQANPCATCSGTCEGSCPFGRSIRKELVEAHQMLT